MTPHNLRNAFNNMRRRLALCIEKEGVHFGHLLLKSSKFSDVPSFTSALIVGGTGWNCWFEVMCMSTSVPMSIQTEQQFGVGLEGEIALKINGCHILIRDDVEKINELKADDNSCVEYIDNLIASEKIDLCGQNLKSIVRLEDEQECVVVNYEDINVDSEEPDEEEGDSRVKWTANLSKLLIELRLEEEPHFNRPICKKKLWDDIAKKIKETSNQCKMLTGVDCNNKYRNLLQTYKHNKEKRLKSTGDCAITWEYFELFDNVLGGKASTSPPANTLGGFVDNCELQSDKDINNSGSSSPSCSAHTQKRKKEPSLSLGEYLYEKKRKKIRKKKKKKNNLRKTVS